MTIRCDFSSTFDWWAESRGCDARDESGSQLLAPSWGIVLAHACQSINALVLGQHARCARHAHEEFERSKAARAAVGAMPEPLPTQPKKGRAISVARAREERIEKRKRPIASTPVTSLTGSPRPRRYPKPLSEGQAWRPRGA